MYIVLTDITTCPRCGPEHGLILLAERIENRRVLEGALGCPHCRERYPIVGGMADLRVPPAPALPGPDAAPEPGDDEAALRIAALMGVHAGPGFTLLLGRSARLAPGVAARIQGLEVVAADETLAGWSEAAAINRVAVGPRLPFHDHAVRAVASDGGVAASIEECARVLVPGGRLVVEDAPPDAEARLAAVGLAVEARAAGTIVACRRRPVGSVRHG
ncbi:MAG TPA: Trm112 family protein [Longimicrobiales bacterium]